MPSFFSNKRLIFLLVSTIIMVVLVGLTIQERTKTTVGEQFAADSVGFLQSVVYKPAQTVARFFEDIQDMRQVYAENQRLKAQLQDNAQLMAKIRELEHENESLREIEETEASLGDYELRRAEVIARSPDRWYQQITINRGEQHGIEHNMAVITPDGLVGRVNQVSQFHSTVELISDANRAVQISAVVQGDSQIYGVIEGYDTEDGGLYFQKIPKEADLEEGQTVITSGQGGLFPSGLYIGQVTHISEDEFGLTQTARVEPAADLYNLDHVLVVERSMTSPIDIENEEDEQEDEGGAQE